MVIKLLKIALLLSSFTYLVSSTTVCLDHSYTDVNALDTYAPAIAYCTENYPSAVHTVTVYANKRKRANPQCRQSPILTSIPPPTSATTSTTTTTSTSTSTTSPTPLTSTPPLSTTTTPNYSPSSFTTSGLTCSVSSGNTFCAPIQSSTLPRPTTSYDSSHLASTFSSFTSRNSTDPGYVAIGCEECLYTAFPTSTVTVHTGSSSSLGMFTTTTMTTTTAVTTTTITAQ